MDLRLRKKHILVSASVTVAFSIVCYLWYTRKSCKSWKMFPFKEYMPSSPLIYHVLLCSIMFFFYSSMSWATLAVLVGEEAEVEEEAVAEGDHL